LRQILDRLDRLEAQNQALTAEVRALREQLAARGGQPAPEPTAEAAAPTVEERLEVEETRTAEQAETKVETAHRLPLRIGGMALNVPSETRLRGRRRERSARPDRRRPDSRGRWERG
jgi:uncharacterized membrane protein